MRNLQFCLLHYTQKHLPETWAAIFDIRIIDADGWENRADFQKIISFNTFLDKIATSTIGPRR